MRRKNKLLLIAMVFIFMITVRSVCAEFKMLINVEETTLTDYQIDEDRLLKENPRMKTIIENKEKYPDILLEMLSRNPDMIDYVLKYEDNKGKVFTTTIDRVFKGKYPLLLQYDTRWGYGMYGDNVIAINGCGPTSVAMVVAGLTGRNDLTPYNIAKYAYNHGYYQDGTAWSFFTEGVKEFGLIGKEIPLSKSTMMNELSQGKPIICSMRKGDFTTTGHIITIVEVKDGKFVINDPNSKARSQMLWDYERIEPQIKNLWSFEKQ